MADLKIVFIGGGSYQWGINIIRDMLVTKGLDNSHLVLLDINKKAAEDVKKAALATQKRTKTNWRIEVSTNRKQALKKADFVITCISTGGFDAMEHDLEIPWKYGVYQTVGDTVGPGGLNRALRNIPVFKDIMEDVNKICPTAWVLNLTNPMSTLTGTLIELSNSKKVVGLCHEAYGGKRFIAGLLGLDINEPSYDVLSAGINHCIWLLKANYQGEDLVLKLETLCENKSKAWKYFQSMGGGKADFDKIWKTHSVSRETMRMMGNMSLAGDRHTVEFFGHFAITPGILTETWGGHFTTIEDRRENWFPGSKKHTLSVASGKEKIKLRCSHEPVAPIIDAIANNNTYSLYAGNLANQGQISNLPMGAVVETPCLVDANGINPVSVGDLPDGVAASLTGHCFRQKMIIRAAIAGDKSLALAALLSDPMVQNAATAEDMLDDMMEATAEWLPNFFPPGQTIKLKKRWENLKNNITINNTIKPAPIPKEISER